jgi:hypothetical protein
MALFAGKHFSDVVFKYCRTYLSRAIAILSFDWLESSGKHVSNTERHEGRNGIHLYLNIISLLPEIMAVTPLLEIWASLLLEVSCVPMQYEVLHEWASSTAHVVLHHTSHHNRQGSL